jgi:hypothetical protein
MNMIVYILLLVCVMAQCKIIKIIYNMVQHLFNKINIVKIRVIHKRVKNSSSSFMMEIK